jgi:cytochrome P450
MSQAAALSRAVATPAHIPESAVCDFDTFRDPARLADARAALQQVFSPEALLALQDEIRTLANQLITLCLLWDV